MQVKAICSSCNNSELFVSSTATRAILVHTMSPSSGGSSIDRSSFAKYGTRVSYLFNLVDPKTTCHLVEKMRIRLGFASRSCWCTSYVYMFILLPFLRLVTVRSKRRGKVFDSVMERNGYESMMMWQLVITTELEALLWMACLLASRCMRHPRCFTAISLCVLPTHPDMR